MKSVVDTVHELAVGFRTVKFIFDHDKGSKWKGLSVEWRLKEEQLARKK